MAVQKYETILGYRVEGLDAVQAYLSQFNTIEQRAQRMKEILSQPAGKGAFAGISSADLNAAVRDYDVLIRKQAELAKALAAERRMERRLAIPEGQKGHVADKDLRGEMRLASSIRIDKAANALADALGRQAAETERDLRRMRDDMRQRMRVAMLGPTVAMEGAPLGPLNQARMRLTEAAGEGARQSSIEAKRTQEEDLAAREAIGKRKAIEARRTQEEDLAAREAIGKRKAIEAKRTQEEDLAAREAVGKRIAIERKRAQEEDLAARELNGRRITLMRKRMEEEDLARREALGRQISIERKRVQEEDLARRELIGRRIALERKRQQEEDLAAREEIGRQYRITRRRTEAEDLAAYETRGRQAEALRQRGIYEQFTPTYASPDVTTRAGAAQADINTAERALMIAEQRRTALLDQGNATAVQLLASDGMVNAANRRLAAARDRLARIEGHTGSIRDQFMTGFRGASDRPYAEQIGQAFKFSVFYGTAYKLLFALTTTMQATLQEGIAFQSAMTELRIASGASADAAADMSENLSKQAVAAGQAPSVGVEIGARSLGLYGVTESAGASQAEQQRVMDISTRVVSRMALGSDLGIQELQTQLAAVANAFGTGAAGQIQAADLDAYLGRQFGVQQGLILQAVAESANVGQAAGFDQEQISAIAAAMISRTGQSPSTAAGWMAQMFSRGGEGSLTALTQKYGIDPNAELADQMAELAQLYKSASSNEQTEILSSFGRGKVQNAAEVLLGGWDEIMKSAGRAETEAGGASEDVAAMRLSDIGGQIQVTVAAMQAFASELGRSGVLDIVGAGVVVFREMVEATTALLQAWNELPGVLKSAIAAVALFAVAARTSAGAAMLGGLAGRGASAARAGVDLASVMAPYGGVAGTTGEAVRGAGAGGAARAALAGAAPWIAAAAGLYALGELYSSTKQLKDAQESATKALNLTPLEIGASADDYRARAAELTQGAITTREDAGGSWMNKVIPSSRSAADELRGDADQMDAEARRLNANAKLIENATADIAAGTKNLISGFDKEGLAASLQSITDRGGSASERMAALAAAIEGAGDAAQGTAVKYDPRLFAAQQTDPLTALLGENITGIDGKPMTPETVRDALKGFTGSPEIGLMQMLGGAGIGGFEDFNSENVRKAAEAIVQRTEGGHADYIGTEEYDAAVAAVEAYLLEQTRQALLMVDAAERFTSEEGMNAVNAAMAELTALDANTQESDFRGRIRNAQRAMRRVRRAVARTDNPGEEMFNQLDVARREVAQRQFDELETMRRAAQRNAKSRAEVARIGQRFLRREIRAAIRGGNQDLLAEIIGQAGEGSVVIAKAVIRQAMEAARAARQAFRAMQQARNMIATALAGINPMLGALANMPGTNPDRDRIKELQNISKNIPLMQTAGSWEDDVYASGSDVPGFEAPKAGKSAEDKKAEREEARQAMLELRNNLYLLSIDMTDPLAMAVAAVKDARRRLRSDLSSGQDKNTIAADRVALRQAQAEREATAFQQRLDSVTTAEELGRISHQKYINYLQNERNRLEGIKNRTFQQQQQLDQIDRLMKDAAEQMQGQWNFGDIKLPTPYQVRRQVEQMRMDRATQLDATSRAATSNTTINIDGADTGKVRQIIHEVMRSSNDTVTNRPRRR